MAYTIHTKRKGSKPSGRRLIETVQMSWLDDQRHAVPAGTSAKQFFDNHIKFYAYYVIDSQESVEHIQMGRGRPFSPFCMGCRTTFVDLMVRVPEDLRPSSTPVLGMCACVTCLECVYSMPVEEGGRWRKCRACWADQAHEVGHLMYPQTLEGMAAMNDRNRRMKEAEEMI